MVTERANHSTAEVGGFVYAAGGFSDVDIEQSVERYDPRSHRWVATKALPETRAAAGGAGLGGQFYMAGGFIPNDAQTGLVVTNSVIAYDPARNSWRRVAPMPTARVRLDLIAAGGFLYAIGGANQRGESLNLVDRYNPRSNSWTSLAPMRDSRVIPCATETSIGPRRVVVVMGGAEFDPDGFSIAARRTIEILDLATGRWRTVPALFSTGRGSLACATEADGTVLAIGGVVLDENGGFRYLANVDALTLGAG
jgi:hypothetical protein